jgi:CheY-like chemotaxis protein
MPNLFDLVITDFTMPKMTGGALIYQLRQIRVDTPIILTSGFNDEVITAEESKKLGIRRVCPEAVLRRCSGFTPSAESSIKSIGPLKVCRVLAASDSRDHLSVDGHVSSPP